MKSKRSLIAILLAVGLCLVPVAGYGEVKHWMDETKASYMDVELLTARVNYMMTNPTNFMDVFLYYWPTGTDTHNFPGNVITKGKILVTVYDSRGAFSGKSGVALLSQFKTALEAIYSFIDIIATNMRTDIVAKFHTKRGIPLGYFYQGEYHLWQG